MGHIVWHLRIGATARHHPHPILGTTRQQRGDAASARTAHPGILIHSVDYQHQSLPALLAISGSLTHHSGEHYWPGLCGYRGYWSAHERRQLVQHVAYVRILIVVIGETRRHKERHHPHPGRGVKHQMRHQRGLARPQPRLPPRVIRSARRGAKLRQFSQFGIPVPQRHKEAVPYQIDVCAHGRREHTSSKEMGLVDVDRRQITHRTRVRQTAVVGVRLSRALNVNAHIGWHRLDRPTFIRRYALPRSATRPRHDPALLPLRT